VRPFVLIAHSLGYDNAMTEERKEEGLTPEELERENGEPLPDREQMSVIKAEPIHGGVYVSPVVPPEPE
jgi:hypothetical protein